MLFVTILTFALILTCCSGSLFKITETPRSQWIQLPPNIFANNANITTNQEAYIPQDYGGNYGDLTHLERQPYDVLLTREIEINPAFVGDTILELEANFGRSISAVWALNFGRQRGFVEEIRTQGNYVYIRIGIRAGDEIRMLIDVYGFR